MPSDQRERNQEGKRKKKKKRTDNFNKIGDKVNSMKLRTPVGGALCPKNVGSCVTQIQSMQKLWMDKVEKF